MEVLGATSLSIDNSIDNTFEGIEDVAPRTSQNVCVQPAERSSEDSEPFQGSFQAILSHFEATLSHFCGDFMVV